MIKLQTKSGTEHFLEACSREERDNWADDITSAVNELGSAGGDEGTGQEDPAGHRLHNVNLRWDAGPAAAGGSLRTGMFKYPCFPLLPDSKVLDSMYDVHSGISMSNHVEQGSTYSNCFSGEVT